MWESMASPKVLFFIVPFFLVSSFCYSQKVTNTVYKDSLVATTSATQSTFLQGKFIFFDFTRHKIPDTVWVEQQKVISKPTGIDTVWKAITMRDVNAGTDDTLCILDHYSDKFIVNDPNYIKLRLRRFDQNANVVYYDVYIR